MTLINKMFEIKAKHAIHFMAQLIIPHGVFDAPLAEGIAKTIRSNYGETLMSLESALAISEAAYNAEFEGLSAAIVLYNCDGDVDMNVLPKPITHLTANEELNEKIVTDTILRIKDLVKGKVTNVTKPTELISETTLIQDDVEKGENGLEQEAVKAELKNKKSKKTKNEETKQEGQS
jgi:hypothetical protein